MKYLYNLVAYLFEGLDKEDQWLVMLVGGILLTFSTYFIGWIWFQ